MTQPLTSGTPERDMEETVLTPKDSVCSRRHGPVLGSPSMIEKTPAPALNETSSDGDNRSHRCLNQQQHFPELMTVCFSGAFICFHLCLWLAFQRICSPSLLLWKLFQKWAPCPSSLLYSPWWQSTRIWWLAKDWPHLRLSILFPSSYRRRACGEKEKAMFGAEIGTQLLCWKPGSGRESSNMPEPMFKGRQLLGPRKRARGIRNSEGAVNVRHLTCFPGASRASRWAQSTA